ncbi:uncharacterized protein CLAFUR5_10740 [Fulvia fulva]|uniref:Cytochrome P450 n=1 Tax=Passalora fulva TaxID=5499 RepID=A0A9Q8PD30_PASFU|nr:uncharacterized protein CLAFUR5_10740 [Fulvia fulva]KAK4620725.1 hypothetical protein CLAFUR0_11712 [Fulvia fulva]UJO20210.1 hypothetical protein CLAFUR5_10740 [Fulvia fulva]WPV31890.1 hypothetical protein CLAFUW7_11702 [Fulvia fulva]
MVWCSRVGGSISGANICCKVFSVTGPEAAFVSPQTTGHYLLHVNTAIPRAEDARSGRRHVDQTLHAVAKRGGIVDVQDETSHFAFDIVSKLGLGERFGFVDQSAVGVDHIIPSVHGFFYISALLGYIPGQVWWVQNSLSQKLLKAFAPPWMNGAASFRAWTDQQVRNRMDEERKTSDHDRDMLDHFVDMKGLKSQFATAAEVQIEVGNLIGAGADTSAIGIAVVLGQLATHSEDYRRIQQEIDTAYTEHNADKS